MSKLILQIYITAVMLFIVSPLSAQTAESAKIRFDVRPYDSGCRQTECRNSDFRYRSGISAYLVFIYPRVFIEERRKLMEAFIEDLRKLKEVIPGLNRPEIYVSSEEEYGLQGLDQTNLRAAFEALRNNKRVFFGLMGDAPVTVLIDVPPGEYYIDYALELKSPYRPVAGSGPPQGFELWSQLDYRGDRSDWGPYHVSVRPGDIIDVQVRPTNNSAGILSIHSLTPFMSFLLYNDRRK